MSKIWKQDSLIPWITNDEEEYFFASIGLYHLRVEQMDKQKWWWRVCYHDTPILTELNEHATCRGNAINLAEGVYYGHLAACREHENTIIKQFQANNKRP